MIWRRGMDGRRPCGWRQTGRGSRFWGVRGASQVLDVLAGRATSAGAEPQAARLAFAPCVFPPRGQPPQLRRVWPHLPGGQHRPSIGGIALVQRPGSLIEAALSVAPAWVPDWLCALRVACFGTRAARSARAGSAKKSSVRLSARLGRPPPAWARRIAAAWRCGPWVLSRDMSRHASPHACFGRMPTSHHRGWGRR